MAAGRPCFGTEHFRPQSHISQRQKRRLCDVTRWELPRSACSRRLATGQDPHQRSDTELPYPDSVPRDILAEGGKDKGAVMGVSEEKRDPARSDPLTPADPEDPYASPIAVIRGGGSYVRLPISNAVVEGLGGSAQLRDRLGAILASEPQLSAGVTPHAAATLTSQYDRLLGQCETIITRLGR